jgi:hypothetical protein
MQIAPEGELLLWMVEIGYTLMRVAEDLGEDIAPNHISAGLQIPRVLAQLGREVDEMRRLKQLEDENRQLKQLAPVRSRANLSLSFADRNSSESLWLVVRHNAVTSSVRLPFLHVAYSLMLCIKGGAPKGELSH